MKKIKLVFTVITASVILFACLGLLGYFGVKTVRRTRLRMDAREACSAEDWKKAEKLLNEYLELDPDSEEDFVCLAEVYRHLDNTEEEMRCWSRACALNPLKWEYWNRYTESALNARAFPHLFTSLSRKIHSDERLSTKDRILYVICAVISNRIQEAEDFYKLTLLENPVAFQRDDLGRFAEFLMTFKKRTPEECSKFLEDGMQSDVPVVRMESILLYLSLLEFSGKDGAFILEEKETLLKEAFAMNRFAITPFLADFYFIHLRFRSVIEIAGPFLANIENIPLSVLYAESCVYATQPERLKPLAEQFRPLGPKHSLLASYFDALYDFCQDEVNNDDLAWHMQEAGGAVQTDLVNLINLQIALNNDNVGKIQSSLESLMRSPPFYDLRERARAAVRHYLLKKLKEYPELAENPGDMAKLAQLIFRLDRQDPFLMRLIIADLYRRNVLTRQVIQENIAVFPYDPYLLQVAAEFELFNGNPKQCLEYVDRFYALKKEKRSTAFDFLHVIALEHLGKIDEAAKEYTSLVNSTEMDLGVLYRYFKFCIKHKREAELSRMAERLKASAVSDLNALAPFFQAEELVLQGKKEEALSLLETVETDHSDFALYAANKLSNSDVLDQALSRYLVLVDRYPDKRLILANIAEVYIAKGMKTEALSYAKQTWEMNQDDQLGQFVYAKMLASNGRYQDAEKVIRMPYRQIELQDEVKDLWTDIMSHCVQEDIASGHSMRALDRANHYLLLFPEDFTFQEFKTRLEKEFKRIQDSRKGKE